MPSAVKNQAIAWMQEKCRIADIQTVKKNTLSLKNAVLIWNNQNYKIKENVT